MNRVNPFYVGLFLIAILFFSFFKLFNAKLDLSQAKRAYSESEKLSVELSELKKVYASQFKVRASTSLVQKKDKSGIRISSSGIEIKALNSIMGKLLNGAYEINELKVKRVSDINASVYMEIKW